ncbi:hypothetical protein NVP1022O_91 [Vibrio phage 1.022.O._10N.286.45.A10]|nr:hypothetical protein NVP1022O_91 [Vibrio phage 1.022.O._10N.286.45.A10]
MKDLLLVVRPDGEEIRVNLNDTYPNCSFRLVSEAKQKKPRHLDEFIVEHLAFEPQGRVHGDMLIRAFKRAHHTSLSDRDISIALSTALRLRGADKSVVSIKGIKLQGYKGVRLL